MKTWRDYIFYEDEHLIVLNGDTRKVLPLLDADSVQLCVTSPPYYGLRDYSAGDAEIGSEQTPREFIEVMLAVFEDVKKVIHPSGSVVLNLGDSYNGQGPRSPNIQANGDLSFRAGGQGMRVKGFKPKDKMLIPHRTAIALCDEGGWWIRQEFPWTKRNPMPSSTTDRAGTATETMFHLAKRAKYFWDETAVRVEGSGLLPGNKTHRGATAYANGDEHHRTKAGLAAFAQKSRDRSNGNRNGEGGHLDDTPAGSRGFRNADLWYQSIEKPHGLVGVGDEITGIDVNPAGFSGEFCTACDRYYHDAKDKKAIRVETQENGPDLRFCLCGRHDKWLSHFATFPQALVEPFIKAGTSEHGQCVECKAPYERIVEKETNTALRNLAGKNDSEYQRSRVTSRSSEHGDFHDLGTVSTKFIGWSKTCKCPTDEREPQTVLDIFGGAGTSAIAARRLGRKCILIELNPEYCKLIVARYHREFEERHAVQASPAAESYAMPLFG